MKNIREKVKISEMLAGKALGSLTEEQKEILAAWESNPENKELERQILNWNSFQDWRMKREALNIEENWGAYLNQMDARPKAKVVKFPMLRRVASIAASFLLLFTMYQLYLYSDYSKNFQPLSEVSIKPGEAHAQLILSTGETVDLQENNDNTMKDGGLSIVNLKGKLKYSESSEEKMVKPITNTLRVPRGGEYQLVLPDGTGVWLNSDTELSYSVPFVGDRREVSLKGEAYFDVAHNADKPFVVSAQGQQVEVLGTEFNISAYEQDEYVVTTLVEGKVKVARGLDEKKFLLPNEQSILNNENGDLKKVEVNVYPYVSWKDGRFVFKNEALESILSKAARWYDVEIVFEDKGISNTRFTGDLPRYSDMSSLLQIIEAETSVHVKVEDDKRIYISE